MISYNYQGLIEEFKLALINNDDQKFIEVLEMLLDNYVKNPDNVEQSLILAEVLRQFDFLDEAKSIVEGLISFDKDTNNRVFKILKDISTTKKLKAELKNNLNDISEVNVFNFNIKKQV